MTGKTNDLHLLCLFKCSHGLIFKYDINQVCFLNLGTINVVDLRDTGIKVQFFILFTSHSFGSINLELGFSGSENFLCKSLWTCSK